MKVSVWDTYVQRNDGKVMHFDILVPATIVEADKVFAYGKAYLKEKPFKYGGLSAKECQFCHIEQATQEIEDSINQKGFYIIEMQNCN
ncbi:MAG: DUF2024 family protein [Gelidibacter sp.]|nr:DUF2024 family protein [Gelidibacter sp.]